MTANSIRKILQRNQGALFGMEGNILSAARGRPARSILVTSALRREGKTTASVAMAYALSTNVRGNVLLVDANFASPNLHGLFEIEAVPGLADFLTLPIDLRECIRETEFDRLHVMPGGRAGASASDLVVPEEFPQKLGELRQNYEYVVFDSGPTLSSSDTSVMAGYFDGIILVVECERTKWEILQQAQDKLAKVGGKVLGSIMNKRRYYVPRFLHGRV